MKLFVVADELNEGKSLSSRARKRKKIREINQTLKAAKKSKKQTSEGESNFHSETSWESTVTNFMPILVSNLVLDH